MYLPDHFAETRQDVLLSLIEAHRLATIVRQDPDGLVADHIPLIIYQRGDLLSLRGHVARANPLWRLADGKDVLVVFQGPQTYISPGWYPSKAEHGKVVPTWNYAVVQAWKVSDAPAAYIEATARAIVGIEITVTRMTGKWKVSQNRSAADRAGVASGLRNVGDTSGMTALVAPSEQTP